MDISWIQRSYTKALLLRHRVPLTGLTQSHYFSSTAVVSSGRFPSGSADCKWTHCSCFKFGSEGLISRNVWPQIKSRAFRHLASPRFADVSVQWLRMAISVACMFEVLSNHYCYSRLLPINQFFFVEFKQAAVSKSYCGEFLNILFKQPFIWICWSVG